MWLNKKPINWIRLSYCFLCVFKLRRLDWGAVSVVLKIALSSTYMRLSVHPRHRVLNHSTSAWLLALLVLFLSHPPSPTRGRIGREAKNVHPVALSGINQLRKTRCCYLFEWQRMPNRRFQKDQSYSFVLLFFFIRPSGVHKDTHVCMHFKGKGGGVCERGVPLGLCIATCALKVHSNSFN